VRYISDVFRELCHSSLGPCGLALAVAQYGLAMTLPAQAQDGRLPPRDAGRASSRQGKAQAIADLIDGDAGTRTGGPFSPGRGVQVDLDPAARIGGVRLHWDSANPEGFLRQAWGDGLRWDTVYPMADSLGRTETPFLAPRTARYLRLASLTGTADWGVSIYAMEPLGKAGRARQRGDVRPIALSSGLRAAAALRGGASRTRPPPLRVDGRRIDAYTAAGVALAKPLRTLEARW
jgi:hypothetical protein